MLALINAKAIAAIETGANRKIIQNHAIVTATVHIAIKPGPSLGDRFGQGAFGALGLLFSASAHMLISLTAKSPRRCENGAEYRTS